MIITQKIFDSIQCKNGRARKRMARRCLKKAFAFNCREIGILGAQCKKYNPLEMELANHVAREQSAKTKRKAARRMKDIEKSVAAGLRARYPLVFPNWKEIYATRSRS